MEHLKHAFYKIRYHVLRLPLVRSIVRWMFSFYRNATSNEIHLAQNLSAKTYCNRIPIKALVKQKTTASSTLEAIDEYVYLRFKKNKNICKSCWAKLIT